MDRLPSKLDKSFVGVAVRCGSNMRVKGTTEI